MYKAICFLFVFLCLLAGSAFAAESRSDFIFSRMKNFDLTDQVRKDYEELEIKIAKPENEGVEEKSVEGKYIRTSYTFIGEQTRPSDLQVMKTYENAVAKLGGTMLFRELTSSGTFYASFSKDGKEYYMYFHSFNGGGDYEIALVEPAELEDVVDILDADAITEALRTQGHIALYINFDTGKATIKPESQGVIAEVVKALQGVPGMKVRLEGHTDNVGNAAANQKLSDDRANAVMQAIAAAGIDKSRLSAQGFGLTKPIADNNTEEGRAKNRRVELVKQ